MSIMNTPQLTGIEKFWYYLSCICTLGGFYFVKLAVKKAHLEIETARILREHG